MYTLIRNWRWRDALLSEIPSFVASLAIAEAFFKFHSFTLECACFLVTWTATGAILSAVTRRRLPATEPV